MMIRTRFAPSPTGYMHIGGMRTALFCWLWARRQGGCFVLRIDDTDEKRNLRDALPPILDAFRWLGLDWDEGPDVGGPHGPYFQSERGERYRAAVQQLLESGKAYRDFEPAEETARQRQEAERARRPWISSRLSCELSEREIEEKLAAGEPHVVRFLIPRERTVQVTDLVRGEVRWDAALMPDPVIARADGSPLYNLATVVDDAQMNITHVIRAEEHLSNTPVQVLLYEALGYPVPQFAHLPFVAAPSSKRKLSKRDIGRYRGQKEFRKLFELGDAVLPRTGHDPSDDRLSPVMVAFYRDVGFLPAGLLNALVRLGWSLDDETEYLSLQEMVNSFHLDRVVKGAAGFDPDKLLNYQAHWMSRLSEEQRISGCRRFLLAAGLLDEDDAAIAERIGPVVNLLGDRLRVFGDILSADEFFVADDAVTYDEKAFQKRVVAPDQAVDLLRSLKQRLEACAPFDAPTLQRLLETFVQENGIRFGMIAPALRVCLTGRPQGPDLTESMALLGRDSCLTRLDRALGRAESIRADSSVPDRTAAAEGDC